MRTRIGSPDRVRRLLWGTALVALLAGAPTRVSRAQDWADGAIDTLKVLDLVALSANREITGGGSSTSGDRRVPEDFVAKHRAWRTQGEIFLVNAVILAGNKVGRPEDPGFHVGLRSWADNIKNSWTWDDNNFPTNHFLHPYHGSLYMNAARSNGYTYWESIPQVFFGSWQWEHFGETHPPSMNDWIITSFSGIAFGETLFRLSSMVLDNTATGSGRKWREVGGFLVSPVRGFNRLVTGEMSAVHANPPDRFPSTLGAQLEIGARTVANNRLWEDSDAIRMFANFEANYGDPLEDEWEKPFDYFNFLFQLNFGEGIGRIRAEGAIAGLDVAESATSKHRLGAMQRFDYLDNSAFEFGGQSLSATYGSRFRTGAGFEMRTRVDLVAELIAGTRSDYESISGREYDYGPGLGWKIGASFHRRGREFLLVENDQYWIHSINGNNADHYLTFVRTKLDLPISDFVGLGFDYTLYLAERTYRDFPDVSARNPEMQIYLSWDLRTDFSHED